MIIGPFPDPITGLSISNAALLRGLCAHGHQVDFINTEHSTNVSSELGKFSFSKLNFLFFYFKIYKILKNDIIYMTPGQTFFGVMKYLPFVLTAKLFKRKSLFHLHGNSVKDVYASLKGLKRKLYSRTIKCFDESIVLSPSLKVNMRPFFNDSDIHVEHNFIQEDIAISLCELERKKDYKEIKLIFISNLLPEKGINNLLDALLKLQSLGINFKIKIAGNIPVNNTNISDKIAQLKSGEYLGVVSGEKKRDLLLWGGNVFCLPTQLEEGQPISILEAMTYGHFILATRTPGISDIIHDKNGALLENYDVASIMKQLQLLTLNQVEQKGKFNSSFANNRFTEASFVERISNLLVTAG
ncbi:glycosyltransferase [Nonlabens ulvanivorans]|uniref:Glycosyltransferase n=1 Tax=Nonlabens ulvanivorans TaxID=906888 RepID=A0A081D7A7_NONUL|nr:glycosyltransferase family 4 protein [Nonlabens ulvanivorans]GAK74803.1 glycosyltransferase [Nonlabens ulvanivorans]